MQKSPNNSQASKKVILDQVAKIVKAGELKSKNPKFSR